MYRFYFKLITLFVVLFPSIAFAHPHHTEADVIARHGIIGKMSDISPYLLIAVLVAVLGYKLFHFFTDSESTGN